MIKLKPIQAIVNFSFGIGSFCAAKRICDEMGKDNVTLVFADTHYEDEDTYKWGRAAAKALGARLIEISDGRNPWQLFKDIGYLGNSRIDPCSAILKRELIARWLCSFDKRTTLLIFGIHWSEMDRFYREDKGGKQLGIFPRLTAEGWHLVRSPLCEDPFISMEQLDQIATDHGLWKQELYKRGFPHANCGGRCVKQGQKGWKNLYEQYPERFAECRDNELAMQKQLGKTVTMLTEQKNGMKIPLSLATLQKRLDAKQECEGGFGGCSCFAGDD